MLHADDGEVTKVSRARARVASLGSVAILLSAIGLAGLAGYTVSQRTREIGLRSALGARAAQVVRHLWERPEADFGSMTALPVALRAALADRFAIPRLELLARQPSSAGT